MVEISLDEIRTRFTRIDSREFSILSHHAATAPIEIRLEDGGTDKARWVIGEEEVEAPDLEAALIVAMEMAGRK